MKKLFSIFILFLILSMPVLANIYVVQDLQGNLIMATDTESQINKYKTSDYQITILNKSSKSTPSTSQSQSNSDIKIVDWTNYVSDTGNYYYVEGILQNIGNSDVKSVRIKVQAFDKNKNLVSITDGYADPSIITPNQKATFSVMVSFKPEYTTLFFRYYGINPVSLFCFQRA